VDAIPHMTGVILAGGKSRRMGEDKRFVTVGGVTLLDRCRSVMVENFSEVLIITAQDSPPLEAAGCSVHQDLIPDCGSLGGLYTGLYHARHNRIFVVACDMPFLDSEMMHFFAVRDHDADIVIGRLPSGLQPLHAVYGKRTLPVLERRARAGHLKIHDALADPSLNVTIVYPLEWSAIDPMSQSFQNVNTPIDLEAARTQAPARPSDK
jgi:molybdopterin-guanine dinucleotide biosynthesis protein A